MPSFSLSKLNNKHFLALMGNGILAVFGVAIMSLLCRILPLEEAGKWFYFLTILSVCDAVRNGFLSTATVKFYAGSNQERGGEVLGAVWVLASVVTAVLLLLNAGAYAILRHTANIELMLTLKWLGITFLSTLPFSVVFWVLQAKEDYAGILWLRLVNSGSMMLSFIVLGAMHRLTLETAVLWNFITNCLTSFITIVFGMSKLNSVIKARKQSVVEIAHYGKYSLATSLSSTLLRSADTFFINAWLGPAAIAIYNWPAKLMEIVEIPLRSFVSTGMSGMAAAFNKGDMGHVTYILKKYSGMLSIAFIPLSIIVFFFADFAIYLFAGHKFTGTEAANIYRILMIFAIMYPVDRFNGVTLDVIHKPKMNFYKVLVMLATNIVADYIGVTLFHNIYGIVFGVFCTVLSGLIFGYIILRKYIDYTITDIFKEGLIEIKMLGRKYIKLPGRQGS